KHDHHHDAERRYLVVPGLRSSRIYIIDTKPDPSTPTTLNTFEPDELAAKTGYSRPHTSHCGPDGIYMSALGAADGNAPGGIFVLDPGTFEIRGAWERDRGPQNLAYDFWWHLNHDTLISSEWGTPNMVEGGLDPSLIGQFGHQLHVWDLPNGKHLQTVDDRFLYVSCWGTGEFRQYDVKDPFNPKLTGSVHLGGIVQKGAHPAAGPLNGGPQMVEISRDGKRVYVTNSLYASWDAQFYPEGIKGWIVKLDADPTGASPPTRTSSCPSRGSARTRSASRAATPRPTPTVSPDAVGISPCFQRCYSWKSE